MATVAVDFDGVIHQYSKGWADGSIYDPPVEGSIEALITLMERHAVFIHTTRDAGQVADWLMGFGFAVETEHGGVFWNTRGVLLVTNRKLPAMVYVDDRAVRFTDWGSASKQIKEILT